MCLSLDGDPETHNKNRNNSFSLIDIAFFRETWPDQPVKMTISKHNIDRLADGIIYLHEQGFNIRGCNFAIGETEYDDLFFDSLSNQLKTLTDYYISHSSIIPAPIVNLPLYLLSSNERPERISCNIGSDRLTVVNADGSLSPCSFFSNISLGKEKKDKLSNILNNIDFRKIECYKSCDFFPICDMCYGENYSSTGNIYIPSSNKCKLMKMRIKVAMYLQSILIARKKEISYEDSLTINTIKKYKSLKVM